MPTLWQLELANLLKTACTRGKLSLDAAREILDTLGTLPMDKDAVPGPGQRQLFELAMRYKLSSYDPVYLEFAMRHGLPIATRESKLKDIATAAGVAILNAA
jgi:predicted nucleic acid-binding protein